MAEILVEACSPPLRSSYSHLSQQLDWHQQRSKLAVAPISPSRCAIEDLRTALESRGQLSLPIPNGHDPGFTFRASKQLQLSRDPSSFNSTNKDVQIDLQIEVDDVDMGGNAQRPKKHEGARKQNVSKQESRAEIASAHSETNITSPSSSTPSIPMATPQLTLTGATVQPDDDFPEEEEAELSGTPSDDAGDLPVTESTAMTAAERLAEKRRMKRFRLTHSQTRFLNSEFSRQPHPDAAQRERLSNEIPGLSPRQVQVWFQNRRAKMKRLSGDDQERMMRSRALPSGFNIAPTLRPTGSEQAASGTPQLIAPSSAMRAPIGGGERQNVTPINMSLVYGKPSYSLNSAGGSSNVSPSTSLQSANASPMFASSPGASPFLQAGGDTFPRTYNPANLGFPTPGNFRARSGSLMSLPASSPSLGGSPMINPRASVSNESIQSTYLTQYDEANRGNQRMYLSEMSNLSMRSPSFSDNPHGHPPVSTENTSTVYQTQYSDNTREATTGGSYLSNPSHMPMPSQSHLTTTDYQTPSSLRRDSSVTRSSTMPVSSADQSFTSPTWVASPSQHQMASPSFQYQALQMRRRQTQPSYPTAQPASDTSSAIAQMAAYAASLPFPPELELNAPVPYRFLTTSPASAQVSPTETLETGQQQQQGEEEDLSGQNWAGMYIPPSP